MNQDVLSKLIAITSNVFGYDTIRDMPHRNARSFIAVQHIHDSAGRKWAIEMHLRPIEDEKEVKTFDQMREQQNMPPIKSSSDPI